MDILLDTCAFLWIIADAPELSQNARNIFTSSDSQVYLSAVSVWEISVKYGLGKLPLPDVPEVFIPEQRELHQIDSLALDEESSLYLSRLPFIHRDPFDRMLICQAMKNDLVILTSDSLIKQYPINTVW